MTTTSANRITNVAIVGAGGRSGTFIAQALLETGQHRVTALTRPDSTSAMPAGLHAIQRVEYDDHAALVNALRGQEALIITMNNSAAPETQSRLIDAAVEAGVQWILPNEWGIDLAKDELGKNSMLGKRQLNVREYIEKAGKGKVAWIGVACSFWYEFSLAGSEIRYGFDIPNKTVTFIDDGITKINTTTFPQLGRAVARLLSLPVHRQSASNTSTQQDQTAYLSDFANQPLYISSFLLSQRDMLSSLLRVTSTQESEWTITHEPSQTRQARGREAFSAGDITGLVLMMYTRVFFPDGSGDYSDKLHNRALGLAEENLDDATRVAVEMAGRGETNVPAKKGEGGRGGHYLQAEQGEKGKV